MIKSAIIRQKLKRRLNNISHLLRPFGINPIIFYQLIKGLPFYLTDYLDLKKQAKISTLDFPFGRPYPIFIDKFSKGGIAKGHYFHQDLLVAKKIFINKPEKHVDIGSRIDGFITHVASFREIEVFDIRPMQNNIPNIKYKQVDFMAENLNLENYCDSVSSLHAIEHFGLGRYGDAVDFEGHIKGLNNINKVLKKGGRFYFSVPIGPQRIEFNAHRVFSVKCLVDLLGEQYSIDYFHYVNDLGELIKDARLTQNDIENNFSCNYGCGIFELTKK